MSFKDQFLKMPPGAAREELIYNELLRRGVPKQLVPITVSGPNGIKITYRVMPDYIMIDGIRVPMAPATAQKVANHFNMKLPTDKMSKQIYEAADTKVRATPLSSAGYVGLDGKRYSGKEVVENRINQSDAAIAYNKLTDQEIQKQQSKSGKTPTLIAGHGKDILQPLATPQDVSMGGWQGAENKPLQPYSSPHRGAAKTHAEYGLYTRLTSNDIEITTPDGKTFQSTLDKLQNNPTYYAAVANQPGTKSYQIAPTKMPDTTTAVKTDATKPAASGRLKLLQRIDNFLNKLSIT